jgi:hypothetical protein
MLEFVSIEGSPNSYRVVMENTVLFSHYALL